MDFIIDGVGNSHGRVSAVEELGEGGGLVGETPKGWPDPTSQQSKLIEQKQK